MTEDEIRKIVTEAIEDELTREGGALDQCREAALVFVQAAIDLKFRNLRAQLGLNGRPH
ncbi:hypothetical protein [Sphingosinicella sp. LY1275]|uniref:hypothetical protein n=1 Tax=Sphingosinicella sp. LY1275 TaxID=3095379 RepID=UPI002ADEBF5F|nr:hypothetical protein [Sphingosinicella sp. LY1275]MEA1015596.1 hypothetical protein [Sphingosinicella sp. LY1275]